MISFNNANFVKLFPCSPGNVSDVRKILLPDETLAACFKNVRDYVVFTDRRLIVVDVQGVTGKKKDYSILPYHKIACYSIETAGHFDMDCSITFCFGGLGNITLEFTGNVDITGLARTIASAIL